MKLAGDLLELGGTLLTAYGLFYAWQRLTGRVARWREQLAKIGTKLTGREGAVPRATAMFSGGEGTAVVPAYIPYVVDTTSSVEDQVARLIEVTQLLQRDMNSAGQKIERVRENPSVTMDSVEVAVAQALSIFETTQTTSALRDLRWALVGIGITALGMTVGIAT